MRFATDGYHQHWAHLSEAGSVAGMRLLFGVYRGGGKWLFRLCLLPVITYFFVFRRQARRASFAYLRRLRAFDPAQARRALPWQSFLQFWHFGLSLIDKLAVWLGDIRLEDTTLHRHEVIEQFTGRNRGAILLVSHLGNFEICRCLSSAQVGIRLTVLLHTRHAEKFNRLLREQSESHAIDVLQVTEITPGTAMLMNERLERGDFIAIAGDRIAIDFPENCVTVDFLGAPAPLPMGPFTLAAILRAPLITLFCLRQRDGYHIYFDLLSDAVHAPRGQRHQRLAQLAERYAALLQHYCLKAPLQWFNFYDFWHLPTPQGETAANADGADATRLPKANSIR